MEPPFPGSSNEGMYAREFVPGRGLWGSSEPPKMDLPPGVAGGAFSSFPTQPQKTWNSVDPRAGLRNPGRAVGLPTQQWFGPNQVDVSQPLGPGVDPGGPGCAFFWDLSGCRPGGTDAGKGVKRSVSSLYGDVKSARAYGDVAALPPVTRGGLQHAGVLLIDTGPAGMTDRSPIIVDLFDYALDHAHNRSDEKAPILVVALGGAPREQFGLAFARLAERGFKIALIRPRDSPCARYDGGCIGVHDWASVRPGDDNDVVAMCFKCGWRNCRRVHPRRCSALVCCALCGQTSHDTRYHAEFQRYVSRRANETTQRQVEAAQAQGLALPSYSAPRLQAIPAHCPGAPPYPHHVPHQHVPSPGLQALQYAMRQQQPPLPPHPLPSSPPRSFPQMMGHLDLSAQPWRPGMPIPQQPHEMLAPPQTFAPPPPAQVPLLQPQAFACGAEELPPAPAPVQHESATAAALAGSEEPPPGLQPVADPQEHDPVDLSRLHYGFEDYVKMGVPEEDARAILRAVNQLAKDRDAAAAAAPPAPSDEAEA